ncbi:tetratricopeptide repeat protein [bacterium]|nr:tetratricopeptide repeat protein [bacterium]MBP9810674.1 tetratricopeptide repeat protein [bacterium]
MRGLSNKTAILAIAVLAAFVLRPCSTSWAAPLRQLHESLNMANGFIAKNNHRKALPYLDRAIELDPKSAEAYYLRGHVYFSLEELDLAERDLNRSISLNPRLAVAYWQRARVYGEKGKIDLALSESAKAIKLAGSASQSWWYQDRATWYVQKGDNVHALEEYNRTIQTNPKDLWPYFFRASIYYKTGSYSKAIADLNIAGKPPSSVSLGRIRQLRAQCYDKLGQHDLAAKDRKAADGEALKQLADF